MKLTWKSKYACYLLPGCSSFCCVTRVLCDGGLSNTLSLNSELFSSWLLVVLVTLAFITIQIKKTDQHVQFIIWIDVQRSVLVDQAKRERAEPTGEQTLRDMFRGREAGRSPFVCTHRTQVVWRVRKLVHIRSGLWHKRLLQRGQLVRATCKTRHWKLSTNKNAAEFYATRGGDSRSEILCNNGHVTHAKKNYWCSMLSL